MVDVANSQRATQAEQGLVMTHVRQKATLQKEHEHASLLTPACTDSL